MNGDRLSALVLLPLTVLYFTLTTVLFYYHRHAHPISDRSSKLSLCRALLLNAASVLLLLHLCLPSASASERLSVVSLFIGLIPASLLLLMRTIALTLRLEWTAGSGELRGTRSSRAASSEDEVRRLSVHSQRGGGGGQLQQPRPSTSITLDGPALLRDGKEIDDDKDEAAGAGLLSYRWMVEGSFLTCLFSPLLVLSLVGVLLLSLLEHVDLSPASSAVITVYALGHVVLFAHLMLLVLCCLRHPAWNELRAEGAVSLLCALLLPVSFGLSIASSFTSSSSVASDYVLTSQYLMLSFYVLTFTSSILFPLLSSLLPPTYLSSSSPLPLQTFVDLLHTADGYSSFLTFLRTEFSEENLLFWKDVNALDDKRREWDDIEERRRRRDREKRDLDAATATQQQQQQASTAAIEPASPLPVGVSTAVNKPLLSLKLSNGLESLSSQSGSSTARGSDSPHSRSVSHAASPKSPSRRARIGSVEVLGGGGGGKPKTSRNTLQPTGSSTTGAGRSTEAISPRSASENGRRVVHNELNSSLPGSHTDDAYLLPTSKRATSYSNSVSPNRKHSGNNTAHMRQVHGSQPPALTLHPSSIHPMLLSAQQSSVHQRELSMASGSYTLPFPLDDSWDLDAISKLRRISWSIALEKKAAKHRASRSKDSNGKTPQQPIRSIAESALSGGGGGGAVGRERAYVGSLSLSPRSYTPRRLSPPPVPVAAPVSPAGTTTAASSTAHTAATETASSSSPRHVVPVAAPSPAAAAAAAAPSSPAIQPSLPTPHSQLSQQHAFTAALPIPQSPSVVKSPFMQSIVRALQATKLSSHNRREDEERRRDDERRLVLMGELVRGACEVYDKYVVAGSIQQVNLPAVIVQQVMERMKEINPLKYNTSKLNASHTGNGRRGNGGMGGHNGMQHTLGLMRHATMHFLAGAGGGLGAKGKNGQQSAAKVHPLLAVKLAKAEEEAHKQRALEEAAMLNDITLLSYPFSQLFADAHHAIEQLMEKDSFKRYLQSPAYDSFTVAYDKQQMTARGRRATHTIAAAAAALAGSGSSRRGSRLAVITPRTSNKVGDIEEGSEECAMLGSAAMSGAMGARRLSDSVSLQLHIRATPREQRNSLSLLTATPRAVPQPSPVRKPLPINTVRMTPKSGRVAGTTSPRSADGGIVLSGRRMEVRRGSGLRDADGSSAAAAAAAAMTGGAGGPVVSIAVQ